MSAMKNTPRLFLFISCAFLAAVYFAPLWRIRLEAPQYPDGLNMYIWINQITGTDEFTLQNINILNHYIGMAAIRPDSFVELTIMAYVVATLLFLGLGVLAWRHRYALAAYTLLLVTAGAVGLADFYFWLHKFGNELSPEAPIVVPGMSYSPPFLGFKTLLNITASSFPGFGGYAFGLAVLFAALAVYFAFKKQPAPEKKALAGRLPLAGLAQATGVATSLLLFSCTAAPQAIDYGSENCHHCQMTISDNRYGAELVTPKGKAYKFDSVECLAAHVQARPPADAGLLLVTDYQHPGQFIHAGEAVFMQSEHQPSPMGLNLTAYADQATATARAREKEGRLLAWPAVLQLSAQPLTRR
jgi:copper chaperone NosL